MRSIEAVTIRVGSSLRRYTKFLIVGATNAFVDLVVLNGLMALSPVHSTLLISLYNTIAVVCAIINSYIWNRNWTFADFSDGSIREKKWFVLQAVVNVAVNDVVVVWLSTYLTFSRSVPLVISSNTAKGLAMFLSSSVSFLFMRLFVFRGTRENE